MALSEADMQAIDLDQVRQEVRNDLAQLGFSSLPAFSSYIAEMSNIELRQYLLKVGKKFPPDSTTMRLVNAQIGYQTTLREHRPPRASIKQITQLEEGE